MSSNTNSPEWNLVGQVGIVTGAGSVKGIGRSTVLEFVRAGAAVVYAADLDDSHFTSLIAEAKEINPKSVVHGVRLDVSSGQDTTKLVQSILKDWGRFDFFVTAAGFFGLRTMWDQSEEQTLKAFKVMSLGVFHAIQLGVRAMLVTSEAKPRPSGTITAVTSTGGIYPSLAEAAYNAAKIAANAFVAAGALQASTVDGDIRVNGVAPGVVTTSIVETSTRSEMASTTGVHPATLVDADQKPFHS